MNIEYINKYGSLIIEPIEDYKKVSEISSKNYDSNLFFDIEYAEKIALITGNEKIQCSCVFPAMNKMFLIHHLTGSMGAVCQIIKLEFTSNVNAEKELEKLNNLQCLRIY